MDRSRKTMFRSAGTLIIPVLAAVVACTARETEAPSAFDRPNEQPVAYLEPAATSLSPDSTDLARGTNPSVALRFELFKIESRGSIAELESKLGREAFEAILKINRVDKRHIRIGDSLIVPGLPVLKASGDEGSETARLHLASFAKASDGAATGKLDLMSLAPFPVQVEAARGIPKLILVSRRVQAFGAYESGKLVRWGPTSTGKKTTPTPAGLYHANWKARKTRSTVNSSWILPWVFNLDNFAGVSFHQYELPGYPASHGCVRLLEEDARWIYEWADQWVLSSEGSILAYGTPVVIFGDYSYGEKPVWKRLTYDPGAAAVSAQEAEKALSQHLPAIEMKARARRDSDSRRPEPPPEVARLGVDPTRL